MATTVDVWFSNDPEIHRDYKRITHFSTSDGVLRIARGIETVALFAAGQWSYAEFTPEEECTCSE